MKIASLPGRIFTVGLSSDKQREFELQFDDRRLEHIGKELLEAIVRYLHTSKRHIVDGEKMGWATSVIRFDLHNDRLQLKSLQLKEDQFSSHADALLRDWQAQRNLCEASGSKYKNTQLADMIVLSDGLLSSAQVREGVRYPARSPYCGWWLFGDDYNGDLSTMRNVHVGDLLSTKQELRKFLALDSGFCFSQEPQERVWFEESVAKEPIV